MRKSFARATTPARSFLASLTSRKSAGRRPGAAPPGVESLESRDLLQFDVAFGLPDPTFVKINQNGGTPPPAANGGWASEIALDVEWAHAIAPGARILLVEANSASTSDLFTAVRTAANYPGVVA